MNGFLYSIWLMPCAADRALLEGFVGELSDRCGTPLFAPHATLCSGSWSGSQASLIQAMERLAAERPPLTLESVGLDWIERWFGFFFLRMRDGAEPERFRRLAAQIEGAHSPEIGPHVSLMYRFSADGLDRAALRREWEGRMPESVRFDSLALIRPGVQGWEEISRWERVETTGFRL